MAYTRSVLITGGTNGLGYFAAREIARQHPEYLVIIASRSDPKSSAAEINTTLGQQNTKFLKLDLSSLANVRSFAKTWEEGNFPPIQAMLLNAALQFPDGMQYTTDGFESTFGIAHVGHALLYFLLAPHLADNSRIVITSSGTHDPAQKSGLPDAIYESGEQIAHPPANLAGRGRYSSAKLANILWTYALNRRLTAQAGNGGKHVTVNAFDPGLMPGTGLAREAGGIARFLWKYILPRIIPLLHLVFTHNVHMPQDSGANLAWVAVGQDTQGVTGKYYEIRTPIKSSVDSYDEKKQEDLWEWTIQNVAADEAERKKFQDGK